MRQLILGPPSIARNAGSATLVANLGDGRELKIIVQAPPEVLDALHAQVMPFVPLSLLLAGHERRSLHVDALVDEAWWLNLMNGFWPLLKRLFDFEDIAATCNGYQSFPQPLTHESALLFSAGIDSFYSLKAMQDLGIKPDWLLNLNAGAHDFDRACWAQRLDNVRSLAREIGARVITLDTNFHELIEVPHIRIHLVRNLSAAYCLFPRIARFGYSSAHSFQDISFTAAKQHGIDYLDHAVCSTFTPTPIALNLLGWDADRITKTRAVGSYPLAARFLNVCVDQRYQGVRTPDQPLNCGWCMKCRRTMLTLDHFGLLTNFASQFPVSMLDQIRSEHIDRVGPNPHPVDRAVLDLIAPRS